MINSLRHDRVIVVFFPYDESHVRGGRETWAGVIGSQTVGLVFRLSCVIASMDVKVESIVL